MKGKLSHWACRVDGFVQALNLDLFCLEVLDVIHPKPDEVKVGRFNSDGSRLGMVLDCLEPGTGTPCLG